MLFVDRSPIEDLSLAAKRVVTLPEGAAPTPVRSQQRRLKIWLIYRTTALARSRSRRQIHLKRLSMPVVMSLKCMINHGLFYSLTLLQCDGSLCLLPRLAKMHTCMLLYVHSYRPFITLSIEKEDSSARWVVPDEQPETQVSLIVHLRVPKYWYKWSHLSCRLLFDH